MRRILLPLSLAFALQTGAPIAAPTTYEAEAADFLGWSPDLPTLIVAASKIPGLVTPAHTDAKGNTVPASINSGGFGPISGGWAYVPIGAWYVPTGATAPDVFGNPKPVMSAKPGFYFLLRIAYDVNQIPLPPTIPLVTTQTTDANGNPLTEYSITAGPVTLTSPPLPDAAGNPVPLAFE